MASFLQAITFAAILLLPALLNGAPFSHQAHLKLKLECLSCHVTASASKTAEDNNLPRAEACISCHSSVAIKAPRRTNVVRFNHALHLKLGKIAPLLAAAIDSKKYLSDPGGIRRHLNTGNACSACHRGLEESTLVTRANHPQMADCLVCHNKIDPPFSCVKCHVDGPELKPASHTPDWLERHNRKGVLQERTSCAVCHGRQFTCLGCH